MPAYEFVALDGDGGERRGVLEGDSVRQIRQMLRDRGLSPLDVTATATESNEGLSALSTRAALSALDRALATRQLSTLIGAGIPIEESLQAAAQQTEKRRVRNVLLAVRARVLEGYSLARALGEHPRAFPHMYRATVAAGEHSGHLDRVLASLADYTERQHESQHNVQMAMLYPVILTAVSLLIAIGLMVYVVPRIVSVFQDSQQELPWLTRALIALSDFLTVWGLPLLVLAVVAAVGVRWLVQQPHMQPRWHAAMLRMPLVGRVARGVNTAQLASTLSILTGSGVPVVEAMRIAGDVLTNRHLATRVSAATQRVSEGAALSVALTEVGYFSPMLLHMVASGEASGELDQMLSRVATHQQSEVERLVTALVRLFEPAMLVMMGGIVLSIVLAVLLPIIQMNEFMGL